MKLYKFYQRADGAGYIGAIITALIYVGLLILNSFILYNYLVFIHMEGRLIDIFTRVTADVQHFFVPFDNEVSEKYLKWIIYKTKKENEKFRIENIPGIKHSSVTFHTVRNPNEGFTDETTYIAIYKQRIFLRKILDIR